MKSIKSSINTYFHILQFIYLSKILSQFLFSRPQYFQQYKKIVEYRFICQFSSQLPYALLTLVIKLQMEQNQIYVYFHKINEHKQFFTCKISLFPIEIAKLFFKPKMYINQIYYNFNPGNHVTDKFSKATNLILSLLSVSYNLNKIQKIFYIRIKLQKMQVKHSRKNSQQFKDSTSTDDSVELSDEETTFGLTAVVKQFRIDVINQMLNSCIQFELSYDTFYIMVGYLDKLLNKKLPKQLFDTELLSLTLILIGSKVNEITPPTLVQILSESKQSIKMSQIIMAQAIVVQKLDYQLMPLENVYFELITLIQELNLKNIQIACENILLKIILNDQIVRNEAKTLALSIISLVKPRVVKKLYEKDIQKIKAITKQICTFAKLKI